LTALHLVLSVAPGDVAALVANLLPAGERELDLRAPVLGVDPRGHHTGVPLPMTTGPTMRRSSWLRLATLLKRSPTMLSMPGTLSLQHLHENLAALEIELSESRANARAPVAASTSTVPTARRHVSFWSPLRVSAARDTAGEGARPVHARSGGEA
jgi:hypothetical protein